MKKVLFIFLCCIVTFSMSNLFAYEYANNSLELYGTGSVAKGYASLGGSASSANIYVRVKARGGLLSFGGVAAISAGKEKWQGGIAEAEVAYLPNSQWYQDTDTASSYNLGQEYIWVGLILYTAADDDGDGGGEVDHFKVAW